MSIEHQTKPTQQDHPPLRSGTSGLVQTDTASSTRPSDVEAPIITERGQLQRLQLPQQQLVLRQLQQTHGNQHVQRMVAAATSPARAAQIASPSKGERMRYVMRLLVATHRYPINSAAGLVGNLYAESGLIPNRVEGSQPATPMRARDVNNRMTNFTAQEIMERIPGRRGPKLPGIGLAQWTARARREGLFRHRYQGVVLGANILNSLNAQVDYLVTELRSSYRGVERILRDSSSSVEDASDEVLFNFERPASVIQNGRLKRRNDPSVQNVLRERRGLAREALSFFSQANSR